MRALLSSFFAIAILALAPIGARANTPAQSTVEVGSSLSIVMLTVVTLEGTSDLSASCPYRDRAHCAQVYKMAAVEGAQWLDGGEAGPILSALFRDNPALDQEQMVDAIFAAAENL